MAAHEHRRIISLRHGDEPADDRAQAHLDAAGYAVVTVRAFAGEAVPTLDGAVAGAVVYGGPFNAYEHDRHPFLAAEQRLVEACIARGLPVLGLCQGGQQIAHALGARVGPARSGKTEFGYYEVRPAKDGGAFLPGPLTVTQAHFHEFDLPAGAQWLATSDDFACQAFAAGSALALQFHPEVTPVGFRRWQDAPWAMYGAPGAQSRDEQDRLMAAHDAAQDTWFRDLLARMFPTP